MIEEEFKDSSAGTHFLAGSKSDVLLSAVPRGSVSSVHDHPFPSSLQAPSLAIPPQLFSHEATSQSI